MKKFHVPVTIKTCVPPFVFLLYCVQPTGRHGCWREERREESKAFPPIPRLLLFFFGDAATPSQFLMRGLLFRGPFSPGPFQLHVYRIRESKRRSIGG